MRTRLTKLLSIAFVVLFGLAPAHPAWSAPPEQMIVFGDSLSDPGNAFALLQQASVPPFQSFVPDAPYARGGHHFSNGATWIEQLSAVDSAQPSSGPAFAQPKRFTNYAVGGARARLGGPFDLTGQVNRFVADFGGLGPAGALYVIWIGGDDLRDAVQALAGDPGGATSLAFLQQAVGSIQDTLVTLYGMGARRFLVLNAPDLGLSPEARFLGPVVQAAATFMSGQFNAGLQQLLLGFQAGFPGVQMATVDTFALLQEVVGAPAESGFTDVTTPCIALNTHVQPFCPNPAQFLFWDSTHPTVAGHRTVAERAAAALGVAWPH